MFYFTLDCNDRIYIRKEESIDDTMMKKKQKGGISFDLL